MQRTVGILKPGVLNRQSAVAAARKAADEAGLKIVVWKTLTVDEQLAQRFYSDHRGRFFYQRLVLFLSGQTVDAFVLEGTDAVAKWRSIIGPTHRKANMAVPLSLRGQFALSDTRNAFHGSGSVEEALTEASVLMLI
jgi:nucleoside-diphosphate kinase